MKIALFILKDRPHIQYQIIKFIENLEFIGLKKEDIIIIEKPERPINKKIRTAIMRCFIRKSLAGFICDILAGVFKAFFYKNISLKYSNLNIKKFSIGNTNSEETKKILNRNGVDISIFICYDEIVKKETLDLSKLNLNVHPTLLPDFRGFNTTFWQLFYNQKIQAITLHKMTDGIDEGDVVFELPFSFKPKKGLHYIYAKSMENIYLLLLMGLRRLLMFDLNFGINQEKYKGGKRYFPLPTEEDIENLAKSPSYIKKMMNGTNKIVLILLIFTFSLFFYCDNNIEAQPAQGAKNIILIGWDGAQREHLLKLLSVWQLPNLNKLIKEGSLAYTEITTGKTETKPGWAEILTGYRAERLEIFSNNNYKPIPKGYTIFERLEEFFGSDNILTVFIGGKINNIGSRGPHEICINCLERDPVTRIKTNYWDKKLIITSRTKDGESPRWVKRQGEPYFNSKEATDIHLTGLGPAEKVGEKALAVLEGNYWKPFFAFFHFEEPDEQGHLYGENSAQYSEALKTADYWLGVIVERLKALGIYDKTTIFVTTDHGMDEGSFNHKNAPHTFLATNSKKKLKKGGDRKDITPTILEEYGIDLNKIKPLLDGKSLIVDEKSK